MNILFTCACGQKSEKLFYILKKNFKKKINIIGCDIKKKIGKSNLDHFEKIKFTSNRIFLNQILRLCEKYKINFLFASAETLKTHCTFPPDKLFNSNPTAGQAIAKRLITSETPCASARSVRINLSRAGVA